MQKSFLAAVLLAAPVFFFHYTEASAQTKGDAVLVSERLCRISSESRFDPPSQFRYMNELTRECDVEFVEGTKRYTLQFLGEYRCQSIWKWCEASEHLVATVAEAGSDQVEIMLDSGLKGSASFGAYRHEWSRWSRYFDLGTDEEPREQGLEFQLEWQQRYLGVLAAFLRREEEMLFSPHSLSIKRPEL